MASIRLSSRLCSLLLLLVACAALAQAPARIRGTIAAFDGVVLSVQGGGQVKVDDKTQIVFTSPLALADIKPGDFLGVTSMKAADGKLTAYEVRRFPQPLNPGHRPFDGKDDQTMTNAAVSAVVVSTGTGAGDRELVLVYDGGTQRVTVPPNASVSELVPGNRSQLVPGAAVNLTHDASGVALRIQVSPKR
jgi:hypothetical protein